MLRFLSRFRAQINAYLFSFAVTVFGRIAVMAIALRSWESDRASIWLAVTAVIYFALLADAGVTRYFSNSAIISYSGGRLNDAVLYYKCAKRFAALCGCVVIAVGLLVSSAVDIRSLVAGVEGVSRWEASIFFICAAASIAIGFVGTAFQIPLRAEGREATAVLIENFARLGELLWTAAAALSGMGLISVGLGMIIARVGSIAFTIKSSSSAFSDAPGLVPVEGSWAVLRKHWTNASAYLLLPAADGISLNLTQLVVGAMQGAMALNAFSAVRIYSRLVWQLPQILKMSVVNELSRCHGRSDSHSITKILQQATLLSIVGMLGASVLLTAVKGNFFELWLGRTIAVPTFFDVVAYLSAAAAAGLVLIPSAALEAQNAFLRCGRIRLMFAVIGFCGFWTALTLSDSVSVAMLALALCDITAYVALRAAAREIL